MLEPRHAVLDLDSRWSAYHYGTKSPLRSAVLLLPLGRPDSRTSPAATDRQTHQLQVCAAATERQLQRNRTALDRSRVAAAHSANRISVRHHERAQAGGRTAHALSLALVHRAGLRSGDPASLDVL